MHRLTVDDYPAQLTVERAHCFEVDGDTRPAGNPDGHLALVEANMLDIEHVHQERDGQPVDVTLSVGVDD